MATASFACLPSGPGRPRQTLLFLSACLFDKISGGSLRPRRCPAWSQERNRSAGWPSLICGGRAVHHIHRRIGIVGIVGRIVEPPGHRLWTRSGKGMLRAPASLLELDHHEFDRVISHARQSVRCVRQEHLELSATRLAPVVVIAGRSESACRIGHAPPPEVHDDHLIQVTRVPLAARHR